MQKSRYPRLLFINIYLITISEFSQKQEGCVTSKTCLFTDSLYVVTQTHGCFYRMYSSETSLRRRAFKRPSGEWCSDRLHCSPRATVKNMSIPLASPPLRHLEKLCHLQPQIDLCLRGLRRRSRRRFATWGIIFRKCLWGRTVVFGILFCQTTNGQSILKLQMFQLFKKYV